MSESQFRYENAVKWIGEALRVNPDGGIRGTSCRRGKRIYSGNRKSDCRSIVTPRRTIAARREQKAPQLHRLEQLHESIGGRLQIADGAIAGAQNEGAGETDTA